MCEKTVRVVFTDGSVVEYEDILAVHIADQYQSCLLPAKRIKRISIRKGKNEQPR